MTFTFQKGILIVAILLLCTFALFVLSRKQSHCCQPRTGFHCTFCPGVSDNECESWMTSNKGICTRIDKPCPLNFQEDSTKHFRCGSTASDMRCCLPEGEKDIGN